MKKIVFFFLFLVIFPLNIFALNINSNYVYFYNLDRDEVIYEENAHEEIAIASMTKIMTSLVALEHIDNLDTEVTLTSKDFKGLKEAHASTAGFKKGEVVTYRDLLYGLMLPSGADAALALANNIAGSEDEYVKLMNDKAIELGLNNTHFKNTTGLDAEGHYSSVYDVAIILSKALENKDFKEIFTTKKYKTSNKRLTFKSTLYSTSEKYNIDTDYILGSKSGYTYDAGLCLASIASNNGETFLLVTAGADYKSKKPYHIYDSNEIYKYYFENYSYQNLIKTGDILVTLKDENNNDVTYYSSESIDMYLLNNANIETKYEGESIITSDMQVGDLIGTYEVFADDVLIYTQDIYLKEKIIDYSPMYIVLILILLISAIIIKKVQKKGKI